MKRFYIFLICFITTTVSAQQVLRDSVYVKTSIFEVMYSEKYEQPLWVKYTVQCPEGTASRKGMNFYVCDSIKTSDNNDYVHNIYDKGHMAPAADFSCDNDILYQTFTYLNCALQHQDLNRGVWKTLETYERILSSVNPTVTVEIRCVFSENSIKLPSGATVPDGFIKIIRYKNEVKRFYFKNEKPIESDIMKYII